MFWSSTLRGVVLLQKKILPKRRKVNPGKYSDWTCPEKRIWEDQQLYQSGISVDVTDSWMVLRLGWCDSGKWGYLEIYLIHLICRFFLIKPDSHVSPDSSVCFSWFTWIQIKKTFGKMVISFVILTQFIHKVNSMSVYSEYQLWITSHARSTRFVSSVLHPANHYLFFEWV